MAFAYYLTFKGLPERQLHKSSEQQQLQKQALQKVVLMQKRFEYTSATFRLPA